MRPPNFYCYQVPAIGQGRGRLLGGSALFIRTVISADVSLNGKCSIIVNFKCSPPDCLLLVPIRPHRTAVGQS